MNRKAQIGMGEILTVFIAVLVGVILFTASAQQIGEATNTITLTNVTFTGVANETESNIFGKSWSNLVVINVTNATGGTEGIPTIDSGNYTLANDQVVNGELTATLTPDASIGFAGFDWQLSGIVQPTTYISSGGGRAIANIILVFFGLAIAIVTLFPTLRNKALDVIGK